MGFLFYLEIIIAIGSLLYIGWIFYPYYKSRNDENISWKWLVNNRKKQLLFGVVPILLVITVYLTVGPVRYTNEVYLWRTQHNQIEKTLSKERNIISMIKSPGSEDNRKKNYDAYQRYISTPFVEYKQYTIDNGHIPWGSEDAETIYDNENELSILAGNKPKQKFNVKGKKKLISNIREETMMVSEFTFLHFIDSKTYYDNKDKIDKTLKSKMV